MADPLPRDLDPRRRRYAPRGLPRIGRPGRRGSRPRQLLLARGHRLRRPRHRRHRARDRQGHLPDRGDRGLRGRGRAVRELRPSCGPGLHPHLRPAARRDRGRCRFARPAGAALAPARSGPTQGATSEDTPQDGATDRRRAVGVAPGGRAVDARRACRACRPPAHDPRDRRPDAVPGDVRRTAGREHPGTHPGAGTGHDPRPRPARVGARPPSLGGRCAVRRRSRHDPPPRAGGGRDRRPPPPGLAGDPARPGRRGLPPGACRGPR